MIADERLVEIQPRSSRYSTTASRLSRFSPIRSPCSTTSPLRRVWRHTPSRTSSRPDQFLTSIRWIIRGVQTIRSISRLRPWRLEGMRRPASTLASSTGRTSRPVPSAPARRPARQPRPAVPRRDGPSDLGPLPEPVDELQGSPPPVRFAGSKTRDTRGQSQRLVRACRKRSVAAKAVPAEG